MEKIRKILLKNLLPILVGVVMVGGIIYAWTEPTQAPPNGNVGAPINTGAQNQTKSGDICTTYGGSTKCLSTASGGGGDCTCYTQVYSGDRIYSGISYLVGYINCGSGWSEDWQFNVGFWGSGFTGGHGESGYFKCSPNP